MTKRLFDLLLGSVGLLVLAPLSGLLAGLILLVDGSPVLFKQTRVGLGGRDFTLLKFRSMAPRREAERGSFEAGSTARVTTLGFFLRRTKLDELPQLWNVIRGDMSLVGPRPEVRQWVEVYPKRWAQVLAVRPGITDEAAIEYRNEEQVLAASADPEAAYREQILPRKLDLYERYVRERSLGGDVRILWRTLLAVIRG